MANEIKIKVPDIGGASNVDVIEILVKIGDNIDIDTPLITLESDKASMEIPSTSSGIISAINVKIGDKVSEGDVILVAKSEEKTQLEESKDEKVAEKASIVEEKPTQEKQAIISQLLEVCIPDIGGATDVDVIDIMVKPGEQVEKDQALITLEGDKATMDIPSPYAGTIKELKIKLGAKVSQGSPILMMETNESEPQEKIVSEKEKTTESKEKIQQPEPKQAASTLSQVTAVTETQADRLISAGPAVRRMARELGVKLSLVSGSGRKGRIVKEDINSYVKSRLEQPASNGSFNLPSNPVIDFSKFGEIDIQPLNKIKKATGANVHRSWLSIPHVTQFDEADITELEAFRKSEGESNKNAEYKLTILAFVCAVVSKALQKYPQFNASLDSSGEQLIYKKYCNLGIAVETPNGLVVPVIKNVDQLTVIEIAKEMARLSNKAREKGLMPTDMSGGCFTISSLGGIGGTAFTPIVNSPEVAILGLSRSSIKPVYQNQHFVPRLMLPLSLSYDHRVIDGAEAARFTRYISECLADIRKVLL